MKIIAEFKLIPIGIGPSFSDVIVVCEKILRTFPLKIDLHSEGTNLEGDYDEVMQAIKQCIEAVHTMGVPRLSANVSISSRHDKDETMQQKIETVEKNL